MKVLFYIQKLKVSDITQMFRDFILHIVNMLKQYKKHSNLTVIVSNESDLLT